MSSSTTSIPPAGFRLPQMWDGTRFSDSQRFSQLQAFGRYAQLSNALTLQRSTGDESFNQYRTYDVPHSPHVISATLHKPPTFRRFAPLDTPQAGPGEREGHGWLPRTVRPPLNPPIEYPIQRRRNDPLGSTTYTADLRASTSHGSTYSQTQTHPNAYTAHGLPERRPRNMEKFVAPPGMCGSPSKTARELRASTSSGGGSVTRGGFDGSLSRSSADGLGGSFAGGADHFDSSHVRAATAPSPNFRKTVTFT